MSLVLLIAAALAADCPPMDRLEEGSRLGTLSPSAVACLEASVQGEDEALASRLAASRLLIAQAFATGAKTDWSRHVAHHLDRLDPDDADLSVRYGAHLLDFGAPAEALTRAEHALEHRYAWKERDDRDDRLSEALSLRARAARAVLDGLPAEAAALERKALEGRLRLYAIEWLAHALRAARDPTEARKACVDTGWEADRCNERARGLEP